MKETKLINMLRTFSKEEMKQFEKFVDSPFHNRGVSCLPLLKELKKYYPEFSNKKLNSENLYRKLYPGKPFKKQVMWNLTSAMEKMTDDFLIQVALKRDEFTKHSLLLLELSSKPIPKYYYKKLKEFEKFSDSLCLGEDAMTGTDFFKVKWKYEAVRGVYYQMIDKLSLVRDQPVKKSEYLFLSFIQNLTQDIYNTHYIELMYNESFPLKLSNKLVENVNFPEIINYAKTKNFEYAWLVEFYYNKLMCLLKPDEEKYFFDLRKMFEDKYQSFTNFENYNTISTLTNYCIDKTKIGKENFFYILFEINKMRLDKNFASPGSSLLRKTVYIQMITTALAINEIGWVKQFIEENTGNLNKELRASISSLGNALLCLKLKKYNKVLEYLINVEFVDVRDKIHVKFLLAQTYYEMDEIDSLMHHLDASKHFLHNNKFVSEDHRKSYGNFLNFLTNIVSLKEHPDPFSVQKLKNEIETVSELSEKQWLLEKINQLLLQ